MAKKNWGSGNSEKEGSRVGAGDFAGMPKEVKMNAYPKAKQYGPSDIDDTMTEIDGCNGASDSKARKHMSKQH